jgi:hypothetical protein
MLGHTTGGGSIVFLHLGHILAVVLLPVAIIGALAIVDNIRDGVWAMPPPAVQAVAYGSATAGWVHLGMSPAHFDEALVFGTFFVLVAGLQGAIAVQVLHRNSRNLLAGAIVLNAAVIAVWLVSRSVGLPVGPRAWTREAVGILDSATTALELIVVLGAWRLRRGDAATTSKAHRQPLVASWRSTCRDRRCGAACVNVSSPTRGS